MATSAGGLSRRSVARRTVNKNRLFNVPTQGACVYIYMCVCVQKQSAEVGARSTTLLSTSGDREIGVTNNAAILMNGRKLTIVNLIDQLHALNLLP
jgi:hypothetical protein